ncbi:UNVERIFIED_CONTAM: hypothetical protein GTU68_033657 [Idotea baltica]|nr:hypothetical protein [Idotea baltica]
MKNNIQRRISSLFDSTSKQRRRSEKRRFDAEVLEERALLDVTLPTIVAAEIGAGRDLYIPLAGVDDDGSSIEYIVTSDNAGVETEVLSGGRSLRLNVTVGNTAAGESFTGDITLRLFEDKAPQTTARIIELVESGFYDVDNDIIFHRVIDNFVAQFGDPTGTGSSGSGVDFADEYDPSLTFSSPGLLAMANSGDDTNDSQMFIVDPSQSLFGLPQNLNFNHTIFGILTTGQETMANILGTPTDSTDDRPIADVTLNSIEVFDDDQSGVVRIKAPSDFLGTTNINVSASSATSGNVATQPFSVTVVSETEQDNPYLEIINRSFNAATNTLTLNVRGTDLDNDQLTFAVRNRSVNGVPGGTPTGITFSIDDDQSSTTGATAVITITGDADYAGAELEIAVTGTGANNVDVTDTEQLSLNPVADAQSVNAESGVPVEITLTGNDGDALINEDIVFEITTDPINGTVTNFDPVTGTLTYTPNADFSGTETIGFGVSDQFLGEVAGRQTLSAVSVNVTALTLPFNIDLAAVSDDGVSDSDDFTSVESWEISVSADQGTIVNVIVNGNRTLAVEVSPGQYIATIPRENLVVGVNSVTVDSTLDGDTATSSTSLDITFAPDNNSGAYYVPGTVGETQTIDLEFTSRRANYNNEIGVYLVDDADGSVNGLLPGDDGYTNAVLTQSTTQILFRSGQGTGDTNSVTLTSGQRVGFYLISHISSELFLQVGAFTNGRMNVGNAFFSFDAANPDGQQHMQSVYDSTTGSMLMHWEDQLRGGDSDFNDIVISVRTAANASTPIAEAVRIPGGETAVNEVDFQLQPTANHTGSEAPSVLNGELGIFPVEDNLGTVNGSRPGDFDYLDEVSSLAQIIFDGASVGASDSLNLNGGLYGFYFAPGSTLVDVENDNPANDSDVGSVVLFSFDAANPGSTEHFRWYSAESGPVGVHDPNAALDVDLHFMDTLFGTSGHFDDFLLSIKA